MKHECKKCDYYCEKDVCVDCELLDYDLDKCQIED